jgi:hypothetical protein
VRLRLLFSLVILVALGAMSAAAQAPDTLQVTIPFAFTVHNVALPAGDYRISRSADGSGLLAMQNIDTRQTVLFLASQTGHSAAADRSSVAFLSGGADYSLADIWWAGYASGVQLQALHGPVITASAREEAIPLPLR